MSSTIKKIGLIFLLIAIPYNVQARWLPEWTPTVQSFKDLLENGKKKLLDAISIIYHYVTNTKPKEETPSVPPAKSPDWLRKKHDYSKIFKNPSPTTQETQPQTITPPPQEIIPEKESEQPTISPDKGKETTPKKIEITEKEQGPQWHVATFLEWDKQCKKLPKYKIAQRRGHDSQNSWFAVSYDELNKALQEYFIMMQQNATFNNEHNWVNQEMPLVLMKALRNQDYSNTLFDPFVQKLIVASGTIIAFHGDIHGDIHSLNKTIQNLAQRGYLNQEDPFKIENPNFYIIFLGDYTDRGWYGPEVMYTLLRLKCANPTQVFMVRGNHEDDFLQKQEMRQGANGFFAQLEAKYFSGNSSGFQNALATINTFYATLPLALYLGTPNAHGTNYLLCCHGGTEIGFDPHALLNHEQSSAYTKLGMLKREDQLQKLWNTPELLSLFKNANPVLIKKPIDLENNIKENLKTSFIQDYEPSNIVTPLSPYALIGFQWNDYKVDPNDNGLSNWFVKNSEGRGWILGKTFNHAVLQLHSSNHHTIRGVFRGHQQSAHRNEMMDHILNENGAHDSKENQGVAKLWITSQTPKNPSALWENIVCTFNVSPHTPYQALGYSYDTYGLLTMASEFEQWTLEVCRVETLARRNPSQQAPQPITPLQRPPPTEIKSAPATQQPTQQTCPTLGEGKGESLLSSGDFTELIDEADMVTQKDIDDFFIIE